MDIKQKIHNHFFLYIIVTLIFIVGIFSYHRFMVRHDYVVGYEGVCDPAINSNKCFEGCDDDACNCEYYAGDDDTLTAIICPNKSNK